MTTPQPFAFIYATRFWALVIGAISIYAKLKGWIGEPEMTLIATITGGLIGYLTGILIVAYNPPKRKGKKK